MAHSACRVDCACGGAGSLIINWAPRALSERQSQLEWLAARNPRAAQRRGDAITSSLWRLAEFPRSGRPGRVDGTREFIVGGTPYLLIYQVSSSAVVILRLLHSKQDYAVADDAG